LEKAASFYILPGLERRFFGLISGDAVTVRTEVYQLVPSAGTCHLFVHSSMQSVRLEYKKIREYSRKTLFSEIQDFVDVSMVTLKLRMGRQ